MIDIQVKHGKNQIKITASHDTEYAYFETTKIYEHGSDKHIFKVENAKWRDYDKFLEHEFGLECMYCIEIDSSANEDLEISPQFTEEKQRAYLSSGDGETVISCEGKYDCFTIPIIFCPICGRDLSKNHQEPVDLSEYSIPVVWSMCGRMKVKASSEEEARKIVFDSEIPLPTDSYYLEDSLVIDEGSEIDNLTE